MFTGMIESLGEVLAVAPTDGGVRLRIQAPGVLDDAALGASIAVNGCCLTIVNFDADFFETDVMLESVRRTTLGDLAVGAAVNLERPVRLSDRLGGHLVQGHVDGVGEVVERSERPDGSVWLTFAAPPTVMRYLVEKGSIAIDGISLTVAACDAATFAVALIPHTLAVTTLRSADLGTHVNLEADVLAKYAERLLMYGGTPDE